MARRGHFRVLVTDNLGTVVNGARVNVYQFNTTTPVLDTLYSSKTGVGTRTNPFVVGTDGIAECWFEYPIGGTNSVPGYVTLVWDDNLGTAVPAGITGTADIPVFPDLGSVVLSSKTGTSGTLQGGPVRTDVRDPKYAALVVGGDWQPAFVAALADSNTVYVGNSGSTVYGVKSPITLGTDQSLVADGFVLDKQSAPTKGPIIQAIATWSGGANDAVVVLNGDRAGLFGLNIDAGNNIAESAIYVVDPKTQCQIVGCSAHRGKATGYPLRLMGDSQHVIGCSADRSGGGDQLIVGGRDNLIQHLRIVGGSVKTICQTSRFNMVQIVPGGGDGYALNVTRDDVVSPGIGTNVFEEIYCDGGAGPGILVQNSSYNHFSDCYIHQGNGATFAHAAIQIDATTGVSRGNVFSNIGISPTDGHLATVSMTAASGICTWVAGDLFTGNPGGASGHMSPDDLSVGQSVLVRGAGAAGADLQTTIASIPTATAGAAQTLPLAASTLTVDSTVGFQTAGKVSVRLTGTSGETTFTYTGRPGGNTTFTGCTVFSGSATGTVSTAAGGVQSATQITLTAAAGTTVTATPFLGKGFTEGLQLTGPAASLVGTNWVSGSLEWCKIPWSVAPELRPRSSIVLYGATTSDTTGAVNLNAFITALANEQEVEVPYAASPWLVSGVITVPATKGIYANGIPREQTGFTQGPIIQAVAGTWPANKGVVDLNGNQSWMRGLHLDAKSRADCALSMTGTGCDASHFTAHDGLSNTLYISGNACTVGNFTIRNAGGWGIFTTATDVILSEGLVSFASAAHGVWLDDGSAGGGGSNSWHIDRLTITSGGNGTPHFQVYASEGDATSVYMDGGTDPKMIVRGRVNTFNGLTFHGQPAFTAAALQIDGTAPATGAFVDGVGNIFSDVKYTGVMNHKASYVSTVTPSPATTIAAGSNGVVLTGIGQTIHLASTAGFAAGPSACTAILSNGDAIGMKYNSLSGNDLVSATLSGGTAVGTPAFTTGDVVRQPILTYVSGDNYSGADYPGYQPGSPSTSGHPILVRGAGAAGVDLIARTTAFIDATHMCIDSAVGTTIGGAGTQALIKGWTYGIQFINGADPLRTTYGIGGSATYLQHLWSARPGNVGDIEAFGLFRRNAGSSTTAANVKIVPHGLICFPNSVNALPRSISVTPRTNTTMWFDTVTATSFTAHSVAAATDFDWTAEL